MGDSISRPSQIERVPSGIHGLDTILQGGFLKGGVYMVMGPPGAGKTILGNQLCYNHVASGGRAVYVTLLAETHARMIAHLQSMSFLDRSVIGDSMYYVSGYQLLEEEGLAGLLKLLRQVIRDQKATILVLDGLGAAVVMAESDVTYKRFLHELQVSVEAAGCTAFLLTQPTSAREAYSEHTMVDGLLSLTDQLAGPRSVRELEVPKFRGSDYLRGRHMFQITNEGIQVHPRIESLFSSPTFPAAQDRSRKAVGIKRLDEMLHGGLLSSSTTLLLGAPGSGKTVLGLHFLRQGAREGEKGLYFGFYETPPRLIAKADQLGLDLSSAVESGAIRVLWRPALEEVPDALAEQMLEIIQREGVSRLFVDSLDVFHDPAVYPDRVSRFFTALSNELRALGVTSLFAGELPDLFGPNIRVPLERVSAILDNIIFLRYVELRSQLYRLISIMKVRESGYEPSIREFRISEHGIDVATTFESAEAILTGVGHPLATVQAVPPERDTFPETDHRE
jgi:circadian clock protein KaiC